MSAASKELIEIKDVKPQDVFAFDGVEKIVKEVRSKAVIGDFNIDNENDRDRIRSMAFEIAKTKTGLDRMGKEFIANQKKYLNSIDQKRASLWDQLEELQHEIRKPLTDFEDREKARIKDHQDSMESIRQLLYFPNEPSVDEIESRIKFCHELEKRDFQEYNEQMRSIATGAQERLSEKLAQVIKAEEDAAELERLRAEKAQRDEQKRINDLATEKAKEMVSGGPITPTMSKMISVMDIESMPAATTSTEEHRRAANNDAVDALMIHGMITQEEGKNIVKAIINGLIPRVKITY